MGNCRTIDVRPREEQATNFFTESDQDSSAMIRLLEVHNRLSPHASEAMMMYCSSLYSSHFFLRMLCSPQLEGTCSDGGHLIRKVIGLCLGICLSGTLKSS